MVNIEFIKTKTILTKVNNGKFWYDVDYNMNLYRGCPMAAYIVTHAPNDELSKIIEPHVCPSSKRFKTIKTLSENGIYTGVMFNPILPFITDTLKFIEHDMTA